MFFESNIDHDHNNEAKQLSLQNLTSVFILLIVGLLLSFLVFIAEITIHKYTRKRQWDARDAETFGMAYSP